MAMTDDEEKERLRQQRRKNWALFAILITFIVVVYFVSIIRMGGG
ncbi:hypothetical protein [Pelagibius litoralis]|nr:hypothetical protein [Pelagibius litoralis]